MSRVGTKRSSFQCIVDFSDETFAPSTHTAVFNNSEPTREWRLPLIIPGAPSSPLNGSGITRAIFLLLIFFVGVAGAANYANKQNYFTDEWYVMPRETTKSFQEIVDGMYQGMYTQTFGTSKTWSLVVQQVPKHQKASSCSNPTKLGGAYGPLLLFN